MNAIEQLKAGHQEALELMQRIEFLNDDSPKAKALKRDLVDQLRRSLRLHAWREAGVFYPALAEFRELDNLIEQARRDHHLIQELIARISTERWTEKDDQILADLSEGFGIHAHEEETHLLASAERLLGEERLESLGRRIEQMGSARVAIASDGGR
ncbi:MAG: hypothetical protein DMF61_19950 [Blastocatellia bacterium AA13]|nr:MAG: hypothetical protein DMF61_19950 [Blastocatellia bacterium AA13]